MLDAGPAESRGEQGSVTSRMDPRAGLDRLKRFLGRVRQRVATVPRLEAKSLVPVWARPFAASHRAGSFLNPGLQRSQESLCVLSWAGKPIEDGSHAFEVERVCVAEECVEMVP